MLENKPHAVNDDETLTFNINQIPQFLNVTTIYINMLVIWQIYVFIIFFKHYFLGFFSFLLFNFKY